ncbi:MAG: DNA primase [Halobacteriovoraceae bacterium]|nr:DNA primase [Halobacteriovoraceae bacterium]
MFDLKAKIKETPISSIIGNYITLTRRGRRAMGLCPFHDDSKPSLSVDDDKNMFMCFVCNTGGDIFTFVQKYKGVDFIGALKELANILNLPYQDFKPRKKSPKEEKALKLLDRVTRIYRESAQTKLSTPFTSFLKKRQLTHETAELFSLGIAPTGNHIKRYLENIPDKSKKKEALDIALEIGLIRRNGRGQLYDTFRERIIFPIKDIDGQVVGFGSRVLGEQKEAKYINSQESFIFNKKKLCYGFNLAKNFIKKRDAVILVEGYMDMITLYQNGLENSVAIMGVGMSDYSLHTLGTLTKNFYLGMDNDKAGFNANGRIDDLCLKKGFIPFYLDYAPHKDPDEFLTKENVSKLKARMENARAFLDIRLEQVLPQKIPSLPDRKLAILRRIFARIAPLGNAPEANERLGVLAKRLKLQSDAKTVFGFYEKYLKKSVNTISKKKNDLSPAISSPCKLRPIDQILLRELILYPNLLIHKKIMEILDFSSNNELKSLLLNVKGLYCEIDDGTYPDFVLNALNKGNYSLQLKQMVGGLLYKYRPMNLSEKKMIRLIMDLEKSLQMEQLKEKRTRLREDHAQCEDRQREEALTRELFAIDKQMKLIKGNIQQETKGGFV